MRTSLISAFLLLVISTGADGQKNSERFSIQDILSSAFPTDLVVSPDQEVIAWVFNREGVRNVWMAKYPDFDPVQVTSNQTDDGRDLSQLAFSHDSKSIYFTHGHNQNRKGESPNPAFVPMSNDQEIKVADISGSSVKDIGKGNSAIPSPTSGQAVFVRGNQIWLIEQSSNEATQLLQTRGGIGSITWSPDGDNLSFVSNRGDHSFIGVYNFQNNKLSYLNPSVDRDVSPVWSPDSKKIAFVRIPNQRDQLIFEPHREGLPWSIWISDLESGKSEKIWEAAKGKGSVFRQISAKSQIFWGNNDRIVFPWEREGFTNLYTVQSGDSRATRLTDGDYEVQYVAMGRDGQNIYYSSNEGDVDRQHVWKVSVDGRAKAQLTSGTGVEWSPVEVKDANVAYLFSDSRSPAQVGAMIAAKATVVGDALSATFPKEKNLVVPEQVIFNAADGMKIHGQLFKPSNHDPNSKYPAVIFFHGGSRRQMLLAFHHRGYYHHAYALNQYLASQGYIVLSVNYRSGIGYGLEFREALNYGATGASEFNDVLGAGIYLRNRSDVAEDKIGLWGGSYGGYLTALGLARASHLFAAGVDIHGVHDWNIIVKNFLPHYNPNSRPDFAELAYSSSPMASVDTWESPVLLIHGDDDRNVPFSESVDLVESLRKNDVYFEQLIFPDEVHGFILHDNWVKAYEATADFFNRFLMDKK